MVFAYLYIASLVSQLIAFSVTLKFCSACYKLILPELLIYGRVFRESLLTMLVSFSFFTPRFIDLDDDVNNWPWFISEINLFTSLVRQVSGSGGVLGIFPSPKGIACLGKCQIHRPKPLRCLCERVPGGEMQHYT